jgi:hypothetical protein
MNKLDDKKFLFCLTPSDYDKLAEVAKDYSSRGDALRTFIRQAYADKMRSAEQQTIN